MLQSRKRRTGSVHTVCRPRPLRSRSARGTSSASSRARQLYKVCRVTPSVAATSATGRPWSSSSNAIARRTLRAFLAFFACSESFRRCCPFSRNVSARTRFRFVMLPHDERFLLHGGVSNYFLRPT
jgi:hypothetical protein